MNVYLKNVRIVDGTGAPAIENGLLVYTSTVGEPESRGIVYVGPMDEKVLAKADKSDRIMDLKVALLIRMCIWIFRCRVQVSVLIRLDRLSVLLKHIGVLPKHLRSV